ncbi:MAG: class I SAM-dependent rRNA methyltransferase [Bacteroidales bacterium]|nr:class I SAM-dependent rRNA methyltransferase [Bacteroidales bacterium]
MISSPLYPVIKLRRGKDEAVKRYHPWIFSGAIETAAPDLQAGDIVTVVDSKNNILGTGFAEAGNIAVKVLAFENVKIDKFFWKERLNKAFELRKLMGLTDNEHTNCYRLVHSEGDNLPGLIIDIYGKTAVVQAQTEGMALNVKAIADALMTVEGLNINAVYNKSSEAMQRMGKDAVEDGYLIEGEADENYVKENDSKFIVDWEEGQKTGFFLDQRYNRDLVRQLAKGKNVLNTFCYTGGFSVTALKGGANKVVSVDCSKKAIAACEKNIALNGFDIKENPSVAEDAKLFLQNMKKGEFDLIILDPPAFAKNHKSLHRGLQGYKFINYEAMTKIKEGGLLFTFSCSQAVDKAQFQSIVMAAAIEAGRKAQIIFQLDQPDDHPVNIYHPEGAYLKGLVLKID